MPSDSCALARGQKLDAGVSIPIRVHGRVGLRERWVGMGYQKFDGNELVVCRTSTDWWALGLVWWALGGG